MRKRGLVIGSAFGQLELGYSEIDHSVQRATRLTVGC